MKASIDLLKTKLKDELSGIIKSFYIGDPMLIPESLMPCLIINPDHTDTDVLDNQRDSHTHFINVSLVIDARQYFDATPEQMVGTKFLMDTMEKEDSSGSISNTSVLGILRNNLDLASNRVISNISTIDYTVRRRTETLITLESILHLEISYFINRTTA